MNNKAALTPERKALRLTSICLLVLLVFDVIQFIMGIVQKDFSISGYTGTAAEGIVRFVVISIMALSVISILLNAYLSVKGLAEAKNPTRARFHISLARFAGIVNAIAAVIALASLFGSADTKGDILSVLAVLVDTGLMFTYAHEAKKVRFQ